MTETVRVVHINSVNHGSTGTIMLDLVEQAKKAGMEAWAVCPWSRHNHEYHNEAILYGHYVERVGTRILNRFTGREGHGFYFGTRALIKLLESLQPTTVHLHNLHENFCNWKMLFTYFAKSNIHVVWSLHDCWPFTGHCPHFQLPPCNQWETECVHCDRYRAYPVSYIDRVKQQYNYKKICFTMVKQMQIVAPSEWLSNLAKKSFFKNASLQVIQHGIDRTVFRPISSDIRERLGLLDQFIIIAVASHWTYGKGVDILEEVARLLPIGATIVAVGHDLISDNPRLIAYGPVKDREELAALYSIADVFFNPTREDVFGLVNLEALACGTPVIAFDTGGVPECLDPTCGLVLSEKAASVAAEALLKMKNKETQILLEACVNRALAFDKIIQYQRYVTLYHQISE